MQKATWHFITRTLASALLCVLASCGHDAESTDVPSAGEMTLSIGFKVPARTASDGYEEGDANENYIDIANGNYRIYFFGTDNKFIARFEPSGFITKEGSGYTQYSVLGKAPEGLERHGDFKVVVLANWPEYGDGGMVAGETLIEDVCNADWAQFACLSGNELNPDEGRLMPFYGVHEYNGITFTPNQATILSEPVTLLRAMAKVEVILEKDDGSDISFSSLKINRYNAQGYCAPENVFTHTDYDHNGNWEADYSRPPHLVGGNNDESEKELDFRLTKQWEESGKLYEKWTVYLPEYKNIGAGNTYSSIKAKFDIQLDSDIPHTIYFAKYENGKTDNSDDNRLDIERNNIYRFNVRCTSNNFTLLLTVSDWEGLYLNHFEYGDGQFTTPPAPYYDEINNDVEF